MGCILPTERTKYNSIYNSTVAIGCQEVYCCGHTHLKEMNATERHAHANTTASKQVEEVFLWSYIAIATLCGLIGGFGNGLVIYLWNRNPRSGAFVYLNKVVRNLAVTDFLYCVLAVPLTAIWYLWGKL